MTIKIHQFSKATLIEEASIEVNLSYSTSMVISQYASSMKSAEATLPFTIEGTSQHTPYIEEIEFSIVVRKKVDLDAMGPNSNVIKEVGDDIGKYNYINNVPSRPPDLPPGFEEVYKQ